MNFVFASDRENANLPVSHREETALKLESIALAHLLVPFMILAISLICFLFKSRMSAIIFPLSLLATAIILRKFTHSWPTTALAFCIALLTHLVSLGISLTFFDGSYDGLSYHQEAVLRLAQGWNPLYEHAEIYGPLGHQKLVEYFPKASWIGGAATFLLTGKVEAGKLFGLTLIAAACFQVAAALVRLTSLKRFTVALLALLVAGNPVAIYQSTTFLVDGLLASLLTVLLASLSTFVIVPRWKTLATGLVAIVLAVNVKFNGVVFISILLFLFLPLIWFRYGLPFAIRTGMIVGLTFLSGVFLFGYAPYMRNLIYSNQIFYPLFGDYKVEFDRVLRINTPANIKNRNRFSKYVIAHFSRTGNEYGKQPTQFKFPLSLSLSEAKAFQHNDLRSGGFGPFFGALLIGTVVIAIMIVPFGYGRRFPMIWFWSGVLLITIFVHGVGWWARYTPQSWLLPLLWVVAALITPVRPIQWAGKSLVLLAVINLIFVSGSYAYKQRMYALETHRVLRQMQIAHHPVLVHLNPFFSLRERLREADIEFVEIDSSPAEEIDWTTSYRIPAPASLYWQESPDPQKIE